MINNYDASFKENENLKYLKTLLYSNSLVRIQDNRNGYRNLNMVIGEGRML